MVHVRAARRDGEADAGQIRRRRAWPKSWSASEDGLTYEFVLRQGAKFHNGEPVTAEDVKFSFERYRGTAHAVLKERVAAVETPDPRHVRFKLKKPWPDFLTFYASATGAGWIVPKKYVEKVGDDGFKKAPIGAGPYKFVSFTPGVEAGVRGLRPVLAQDAERQAAGVQGHPGRDDAARGAQARRGRHRLFDPRRTRRGAAAHAGADLEAGGRPGRVHGSYFPDQWDPKSPWHDERVRRAASLAIDRKGINDALTLGYSQADQQHHSGQLRILLAAAGAGLRPGEGQAAAGRSGLPQRLRRRRVLLRQRPTPMSPRRCSTISGRSASGPSCGRSSGPPFSRGTPRRSFKNIIQAGSGAFGNAATRLEAFVVKGGTYVYGSYPDIDELFQQQAVELDHKKREAILHKMQQLVYERAIFAPIWQLGFHQRRRAAGRRSPASA